MRISTVFRKLLGVTAMVVRTVLFEEAGLVIDVKPSWRKVTDQRRRDEDRAAA